MFIARAPCLTMLCLALCAIQVPAQEAAPYPSRPLKLVVPLTPGTTTDQVAREFADRMSRKLGQPVVVDNRPGAGGIIAAQAVAKSAPDGYTILMVNSQHAINPAAYASMPYDTLRDFTGIALIGDAPAVITVPTALGVRNLAEFIALARQHPGAINYGSSGIGSQTHLAGAYFAAQAGVVMTHVPYRSSEVITDLVTNRIQSVFTPSAFVLGQIREGKLQALAVAGHERLGLLRDVPTTSEAGLPAYQFAMWFGFVAPGKVPAPIVGQLARTMQAVLDEPTLRQKFAEQGLTPRLLMLAEFDAYIQSEMERLGPIVKASGVHDKPREKR
ncbi:tripartite tricarboxylate transporter substrate binding protein [Verminephrobacter eiseniae]|uniref:tripartite tricarboxylate transporter substrate binding protein n=1 Tax=Verminephrobacter eiseniae TaxID=364317 RepID=UPI0010EED53F|nr:tripartite tricarboxylate transporter substrate binding protein [Verminephrobacter eiseniae]KAB7559730.1 tripartite tricarboxylate transporter substrate binding protein [Verminephrobacter sp. Larva24]MCW5231057.1 tripartite tricarboxylate transporter substrate binding protein [Verminephrobacter eiseniae]MCW5292790.1 tripartite tricarboxylate transporter substrate binding protein [Verminephrobacter eiseniae]MCW8184683.1 tripartite tricarboxylate transporter substrate binding protein [Verminep